MLDTEQTPYELDVPWDWEFSVDMLEETHKRALMRPKPEETKPKETKPAEKDFVKLADAMWCDRPLFVHGHYGSDKAQRMKNYAECFDVPRSELSF